jgi:hypothetical protein
MGATGNTKHAHKGVTARLLDHNITDNGSDLVGLYLDTTEGELSIMPDVVE